MKKFLLIILSAMLVLVCCSCSKKVEEVEVVTDEKTISSTVTLKGKILDTYKDIEGFELEKFLATAVVNVRPKEYRKNDIPVITKDMQNSNIMLNLMHIDDTIVEKFVISGSQNNTRAYTVAICKAHPGMEQQLVNSYNQRIVDLKRINKEYPDQMYLIENYEMHQVGEFLVLVICDNSDKVFSELKKVMDNYDLTTLTEVPMLTDLERENIENDALEKVLEEMDKEIKEVVITPVEENTNSDELTELEELE